MFGLRWGAIVRLCVLRGREPSEDVHGRDCSVRVAMGEGDGDFVSEGVIWRPSMVRTGSGEGVIDEAGLNLERGGLRCSCVYRDFKDCSTSLDIFEAGCFGTDLKQLCFGFYVGSRYGYAWTHFA
ncbi:hypothetical protein Dimus_037148 [Dionaea muscipula]